MSTVLHRLDQWAHETPYAPAQRYKSGGEWTTLTARDVRDRVHHLALFLESRGFDASQIGAILSYNCPQWVHVDLAALLVGGKSAGLYPNSTAKDIQYILAHTEATLLAVQNREYFQKISGEKGESAAPDSVRWILVFDGDTSISPKAISYESALAEGRALAQRPGAKTYADYLAKIDPKAGAFLIYTSGTTGNPKGAMISHDNLAYTSDMVVKYWGLPFARGTMFSFLPLCHIAEKLQNVGVGVTQRYTVSFCSKFENVSVELPEVQPTLLLCVPRLWEKMMEGVMAKVRGGKGAKKKLAEWALSVGARVAEARYAGRAPSPLDALQLKVADKLVLGKVRAALGLGKAEMLASGAAALAPHISTWFRALGLEILEDFGQTESTGVICMTEPGVESAGTVGKPVPGVEFKLAEDGEILTRGRHVFVGYYKDEAATAAALEDGWLHTGDLGEWNERGQLKIRGRKKEILKTSGGKMIAPLPIEEKLKAAEIISQVCMVGDGRKYLSALITLTESKLAELKGRGALNGDAAITTPEVVDQVKVHIDALNAGLASFEQIKKFTVLGREFSVQDGEMTPTLKMKRNVIEQRFRGVIDQMYAE
ncbi:MULTISPECIES: long-chain fatty acid--CoA ligase [Sorangium]|uniref:Long-chain fatty acid--CoA ligase n=1 Tax=Sorangium cellulosum TaxID=56 RepID=A0A4P2QH63_SORCE|nr:MULTISPECIES: long-chain fatty acid--CoA ligase [Sorangium]AUX29307.1 long-chain fatty acid--CoA ligase [Sorangium cellulosum]WCQ88698.1 Long-chain-fatty-acid--CoA ligase FadD15 [Sorangium sp. Soce836]